MVPWTSHSVMFMAMIVDAVCLRTCWLEIQQPRILFHLATLLVNAHACLLSITLQLQPGRFKCLIMRRFTHDLLRNGLVSLFLVAHHECSIPQIPFKASLPLFFCQANGRRTLQEHQLCLRYLADG